MSNISITYDGKNVFNNIPTPFISVSQDFIDYGTRWDQVTNLSLDGQITGGFAGKNNFDILNSRALGLVKDFSKNYKNFTINQGGNTLYEGIAVINSINFNESDWYSVLPYNIDLSIYEENLFSDYYGIVEPEESFSFSEEEGLIVDFTHSLSAKGLFPNAIEQAKNWVIARTGEIDKIKPILIKNSSKSYLLQSIEEKVDRFNGVYSWVANYKKSIDNESPDKAFLSYSIELSSGIEDGFILANINGSLEGNSIDLLRQEFNKLQLFNICSKVTSEAFDTPIFNQPRSASIQEIPIENKLTFSYSFNNDFSPEIINNYSVDINTDSLTCITNVNLNANISCKYGDIKTKWEKVKLFYQDNFNPFSIAQEEYQKESTNKLNVNPITESIKYDEFNATIQYSAQYTDKKQAFREDILNMSSSATLSPSIKIHVPKTSAFVPREHNIQNLNTANRTTLNINVTAVGRMNASINTVESTAAGEVQRIKNNYQLGSLPFLEEKNIAKNDDLKTVTINETWSYEGNIIT